MIPGLPYVDMLGGVRHPFHGVITAISMTVQPFLRKELGLRYFKITDVIGAFVVARLYELICYWFDIFGGAGQWYGFPWFTYSFLALSLLHLGSTMLRERAWQQGRAQEPIHTQYHGTSWLSYIPNLEQWGFNQRRRLRILEPACVLVIGLVLRPFDPVTGTWLVIAAAALFVKNNLVIQRWINRQRDLMDARIESGHMHRTTTRPQAAQQQGSMVRPHRPRQHNPFLDEDALDIADTVQDVMGYVGHAMQDEIGDRLWDGVQEFFDDDDPEN
ncbi:MAG: hypothetical protein R3A44_30800 [Caldilineaceae bacterium]